MALTWFDCLAVNAPHLLLQVYGRRQQQCAAYLEADCGRGITTLGAPGSQQWVVERAGVMELTEQGPRHNTTLFRILAKVGWALCSALVISKVGQSPGQYAQPRPSSRLDPPGSPYPQGSEEVCGVKGYLGARGTCGSRPQLGLVDLQEANAATVFQLLHVPQQQQSRLSVAHA